MLIGEGQEWLEGMEQAWELLAGLSPGDVCRNSKAGFNKSDGCYILPVFNEKIYVSTEKREIWGDSVIADVLLNELPHFSVLPALWYLNKARDIPPSGNLVNPREIKGGQIFTQGSYILPLDRIIENYGSSARGFLEKGGTLGSEQLEYGDASLRLLPFPRIPVVFILWEGDQEFPARADILFDETCSLHLPTDTLWSMAMLSILMMTR